MIGEVCEKIRKRVDGLQRLAGRAHEVAQNGHIGAVRADASGVHRQTQALGQIQVHAGIVQFGQAETLRGQHAVQPGRIDRPGWAVTLPGAARQLIKLLPIAFVPSRHSISIALLTLYIRLRLSRWMQCWAFGFTLFLPAFP